MNRDGQRRKGVRREDASRRYAPSHFTVWKRAADFSSRALFHAPVFYTPVCQVRMQIGFLYRRGSGKKVIPRRPYVSKRDSEREERGKERKKWYARVSSKREKKDRRKKFEFRISKESFDIWDREMFFRESTKEKSGAKLKKKKKNIQPSADVPPFN